MVAASDGALTEKELAWHVGQGRSVGVPEDVTQESLKFDPVGQRIEDHVDATLQPYARLIVFDALRAAHADGLHQKEEKMARRAAAALQLGEAFSVAVLNQLHVEEAVRQARLTLLRKA